MFTDLARLRLIAMGIPPIYGGDPDPNAGASGGNGQPAPTPNNMPAQQTPPVVPDPTVVPEDEDEESLEQRLDAITDPKDRRIAELSAENARRRTKNVELNRELAALKGAKTKASNKDDSATQALQAELDRIRVENEAMQNTVRRNLIETSILKYSKISWHDVGDVVRAIDPEEIKVDLKTGKIEGLPSELKRIAREKPHYVKASELDENGSGQNGAGGANQGARNGGRQQPVQQPSGVTPGAPGTVNDRTSARRAELEKKYSILKR